VQNLTRSLAATQKVDEHANADETLGNKPIPFRLQNNFRKPSES
jgi:hypothetical protein